MIRPLDRVRSIRTKLGVVVVGSTLTGLLASLLLVAAGLDQRLALLPSLAVAVLAVQLLAHGMTAPLREMSAAAQVMAHGQHGVRVRATARDEVGRLAESFNTMAAELAEVDAQRRRLVADVSHELRTPLTALQALLENLADGVAEPDPETLEAAVAQTRRLGRLVTQLLDLSRLEAGQVPLQAAPLELAPLLESAAREARLSSAVPVSVRVEPAGLTFVADRERLLQVLANLLENACRHARSEVEVAAEATPAGVRLVVADDGPGIPAADRERVFERFTRTDSARTRRDGGSGLGLSIVRWVVELHRGTVHVLDAPHGCRIAVDLPRSTA